MQGTIYEPLIQFESDAMSCSIGTDFMAGVPLIESPFFHRFLDEMNLSDQEREIAVSLNRDGFATFDFPDADIKARMERIVARLGPMFGKELPDFLAGRGGGSLRLQDAWYVDEDVKAIACNDRILELLSKLYGRRAFPFQTLNFPIGTQQAPHSDSVHFSSLPERFMCGVWLAFEDISADAGPLIYYPGSHKWPIASNSMLGRNGSTGDRTSAQQPFEAFWQAMVAVKEAQGETFLARKGQALIWAANLLHGGSAQNAHTLTRWSQVTHYYFKDCIYYTPAFSDETIGKLDMRHIVNIASGEVEEHRHLGTIVPMPQQEEVPVGWRERRRVRALLKEQLPEDFDAEVYYMLNPDVALGGIGAERHYVLHGLSEGRRYKY